MQSRTRKLHLFFLCIFCFGQVTPYYNSRTIKTFIEMSEAQQPVINGTFTLECIAKDSFARHLFVDWSYPNKNETGSRINEVLSNDTEAVKKLVVKNAKSSDSGEYICSATDHLQKASTAKVNIFVYDFQQPVHVYFTTNISISEPVVYQAGQDVRFVITVHAFPSITDVELYWKKNGELLVSDSHYHIKTMSTPTVLEINQLNRTDAATYTLYGKTKDGINSISILLEVKDKPIVVLKNMEMIYSKDKECTIECRAHGYPPLEVRWRWNLCMGMQTCRADMSYGWTNEGYGEKSHNKESVTLEFSDVRNVSVVSYLHVTATQSGFYSCVAENEMGGDNATVLFIASDAAEGFEISISERNPIDEDYVELVCKVSIFIYTDIEWKWRPMYSDGEFQSTYYLVDVSSDSKRTAYSLSEIIVFNPIHRNMSGEYKCTARSLMNITSTATQTITIDVEEIKKPVLNKTNLLGKSILTALGKHQELFCFTHGVPFPDLTWRKDGKIFDVSNMSGVELTERNQKLTIWRVLDRDAGFYECIVKNRGGQIVADATLETDNKDDPDSGLTVGEIVAVAVFGVVGAFLIVVVSCLVQRILK